MRILVVDDEPDLRELLRMFLERRGHEVVEAKDGVEGVFVFRHSEQSFDWVVSDNKMPRMTGIDMCLAIRQLEPTQKMVIQSADASLYNLMQRAGLGDVQFLEKPYPMDALFKVIGD